MAPDSSTPDREERRALIARILNSQALETSERLRALLCYLAERCEGDQNLIREQEIGVAVFSRPEGYDTSHDTLVRVQISNLRKKLQLYFEEGGCGERWEVQIPKGNYGLLFRPLFRESRRESRNPKSPRTASPSTTLIPPLSSVEPAGIAVPPGAGQKRGFWAGLAVGMVLATMGAGLFLARAAATQERIPANIAAHPIWSPFRSSLVTVAISTPLFFFSERGFERDFRLNYAEDLADASRTLLRQPAAPEWDRWAPFSEVVNVARLQESLGALGSRATVRSARDVSASDIRGRKTIVLGHPRGAPVLLEAMKDLNFQPPPRTAIPQNGFINTVPQKGEEAAYGSTENTPMERSAEATADYALITSLRLSPDGELLSLFGNRVQTSALVLQKLLDPAFMAHLNERVFGVTGNRYKSCQIVLRVDYAKGNPIDAVYVTHRVM